MQSRTLSILIAENNLATAQALASSLDRHFRSVKLARSSEELRSAIPHQRVDAVVADLETIGLKDVSEISHSLHVPVICTHRVPDEDMWTAALNAGAVDVCSNDPGAIVDAVSKNLAEAHRTAA